MDEKYIAMIVIGGILLFMFLLYFGCFIEITNDRIHSEKARHIYYSSKNLAKMEYDIAFPSNEACTQTDDEQLTIDEVINDEHPNEFVVPIFNVSEFEGSKEITGGYNPDVDD